MIANDVLNKARFTLSDTDKTRWSDTRLLSLLNDAILDVALTTDLYNSVGYIKLQNGVSVYDTSSFAVNIERIEHLDKKLQTTVFEDMDENFDYGWQSKTSDKPTHIVYDLKKGGEFVVYPIPKTSSNVNHILSPHGIITDVRYEDIELTILSGLGGINNPNMAEYLKVYYTRKPNKITAITDTLESVIDPSLGSCLSHYIAGMALRDNTDARNRQVGNEEISFYENKKYGFELNKTRNNNRKIRTTVYNPFG